MAIGAGLQDVLMGTDAAARACPYLPTSQVQSMA
jgi:hypothetical protein